MRQDFYQLGEDIMALVLATLTSTEDPSPVQHVPTLVVRDSTRPL